METTSNPADESAAHIIDSFRVESRPNYIHQGDEEALFRAAHGARIPLIVKGPTGCGKTRFIEHMAWELSLPLVTVSCHEDLTAADLVGRFLFHNDQTVWRDGPLTMAVRHGGICYLDEIVEARKDTTVIIHSLTDDRRILYIDKTGEVVRAHPDFMVVLSYNPGYQSIVKDLKHSTKQRFASLNFDHPRQDVEARIIETESGLTPEDSTRLAEVGAKIRELRGFGLEEGVSTRLLVYVGRLVKAGLSPRQACEAAVSHTLTEEPDLHEAMASVVNLYFGDLMESDDACAENGE
ncbi:MAG: CbbQ/NirQ/NorQ/GpvN family protein [Lentisphaeria bacterium]|nr:CbbQ/NirQ/NorQ/GpvN family protein [Lentisphaeria bacterium]